MNPYELIDRLLDVAISCEYQYPYVIVHNTPLRWPNWTPEEIAEALDIDPETVTTSVNGNIRIIANDITL